MGAKFNALKAKLAAKGASDPAALAAYIGRKKYGKAGFAALAAKGKRSRGEGWEIREVPFQVDNSSDDGLNFSGYAAVFNSPTRISDYDGDFDEIVRPGAFARSLRNKPPVLMFNHGKHPLIGPMPLGRITDAREDSKGVFIRARLTDNWLISPVRDAISNEAVKGMSFRFSVPDGGDKWNERSNPVPTRELLDIDVPELGPVVFPAYEPTTASVRSSLDHIGEPARRPSARSTGGGTTELTTAQQDRIRAERDAYFRSVMLKGIPK